MNKYHAQKTVVNGQTFDSKHEAQRYADLLILQRAGVISNLRRQVPFELSQTRRINGVTIRGCSYVADFVYDQNGHTVVEDAKGFKTEAYKIKRKWMAEKYGILIKES